MKEESKLSLRVIVFWAFSVLEIALLIFAFSGVRCMSNKSAMGIFLNIIGVFITFIFAFPQSTYSQDIGLKLQIEDDFPIQTEGGEMSLKDYNTFQFKMGKVHRWLSLLGFSYLLSGLCFQLAAAIGTA